MSVIQLLCKCVKIVLQKKCLMKFVNPAIL